MVHVVWDDFRNGSTEIYYNRSTDAGTNWGADTRLTNNPSYSGNPSVGISYSTVHVVWYDSRDGNSEIYYKKNPTGNIVGINQFNNGLVKKYDLSQNYPNPFNPVTNIKFDLPKSGFVEITIYDLLGREVTQLVNQHLQAGSYSVDWDASNYPSGVYFYSLVVGDNTNNGGYAETKKMVLIK
jgi:hypothetical protein